MGVGTSMAIDANEMVCDNSDCAGNVVLDRSKLDEPTGPLEDVVRSFAGAKGWISIEGADFCPLHSPSNRLGVRASRS